MANYSMAFGYKFYIVPVLQNYVDFTPVSYTHLILVLSNVMMMKLAHH